MLTTTISREMLTTALSVVHRNHWGAAHRPSSGDRPAPVSAQAVGGRAGELADLGQDPKFTEARPASSTSTNSPNVPVPWRAAGETP